jgi:hypothetical protein
MEPNGHIPETASKQPADIMIRLSAPSTKETKEPATKLTAFRYHKNPSTPFTFDNTSSWVI